MKTIRVFTVDVSGCKGCPQRIDNDWHGPLCNFEYRSIAASASKAAELCQQNASAITPSCPRYAESKLIEVKE